MKTVRKQNKCIKLYLSATAFLMTSGGEGTSGVPSFILFTFTEIGDDLFLFRFFPPRGVFGVFKRFPVDFLADFFADIGADACFNGLEIGTVVETALGLTNDTGEEIGEADFAFDLADAAVEKIGVLKRSDTPVKLRSKTLLLLLFFRVLPVDFLLDFTCGDFLDDFTGVDFLDDFGVLLDTAPDMDLALLEVLAVDDFAGSVFGVLGLDDFGVVGAFEDSPGFL